LNTGAAEIANNSACGVLLFLRKIEESPTLALIPIVRDAGMRNNPGDMSPGIRAMAVDVFREDLDGTDVQDDGTVSIYD
jgi:hypothetical protein